MIGSSYPRSSVSMSLILLLTTFLFIGSTSAGWVLEDDYATSEFFDMFTFWTAADPTDGFVEYVSQSTAQSAGLINTDSGIYIGVDYTNDAPDGRQSVRLTSTATYNAGTLVILDLEHMPGGICATWPAFWTVGPDWPAGGEIDIIEGVHMQTTNDMTLHTSDGCSITNNNDFTGTIYTDNCYIYADGQSDNEGCQIDTTNTATYGSGFNSNGGGVYAMLWTTEAISIYFFQRGSIPSDVSSGSPDPSGWGEPVAEFQGDCDIPSFFTDNQLVFDNTFCGTWAGATWSSSGCASTEYPTCEDYVANNPSAFKDAYWQINSLQVFSESSDDSSDVSSGTTTTSTAAAASTTTTVESSTSTSEVASTTTAAVVATTSTTSIAETTTSAAAETTTAATTTIASSTSTTTTSSAAAATTSDDTPAADAEVESDGVVAEDDELSRRSSNQSAPRSDAIDAKLTEQWRRQLESEKLGKMRHARHISHSPGKWRH